MQQLGRWFSRFRAEFAFTFGGAYHQIPERAEAIAGDKVVLASDIATYEPGNWNLDLFGILVLTPDELLFGTRSIEEPRNARAVGKRLVYPLREITAVVARRSVYDWWHSAFGSSILVTCENGKSGRFHIGHAQEWLNRLDRARQGANHR